MKEYFVYMLTNKYHNVLYIGVTNNIRRRVYEHKRKLVYGFTSKYNCTNLVWYETFTDVNLAITREKQIKVWQRSWKNNLIEKHNSDWHDLAADWVVKSSINLSRFQRRLESPHFSLTSVVIPAKAGTSIPVKVGISWFLKYLSFQRKLEPQLIF